MNWILPALVGACTALVTLIACGWWFGRRRLQRERDLLTVPPSEFSLASSQSSSKVEQDSTAQSIELLERQLNESEAKWHRPRPFLDTSPLTHELEERTRNVEHGKQ